MKTLPCDTKRNDTMRIRVLSIALLVVSQIYWICSNYASIFTTFEVSDEPVAKTSNRIDTTGYDSPSIIEKHTPIPIAKGDLSQNEGADKSIANQNDQERIVLFVHFHKAGGTSMVRLFTDRRFYGWRPNLNGIPYGRAQYSPVQIEKPRTNDVKINDQQLHGERLNEDECRKYNDKKGNSEILKFWMYSRSQFEAFLRHGHCLGGTQVAKKKGVFISLEWNFFNQDHFFEKDYLRQKAKIDMVTILRDPYDRFISNFYFSLDNPKKNYTDPMEWSHLDLVRKRVGHDSFPKEKKGITRMPHYQYGEQVPNDFSFSVNYNKPNYYTAFLNGLAENTDDLGWEPAPFDFEYFAFGLNQTHLDIAKQRLETMFDAVLILERPETHVQLDRWFPHYRNMNRRYIPHHNKGDTKRQALNITREEFYRYNALDKELYEYALELSRAKSASKSV